MQRAEMLARLSEQDAVWDVLVIGGGATGVGIALDAASRGYRVALAEQSDFGKGTSSRSTKLIHGGVRYLQRGQVPLVFEALRERGLLRQNAPHLVQDLKLLIPSFGWRDRLKYRAGLKLYDWLAGRRNLGHSQWLSPEAVQEQISTLRTDGLHGAVLYHDGQFDDARLLIAMVRTAAEHGAVLANYVKVVKLTRGGDGMTSGAVVADQESGGEWSVQARIVINATGPFADSVCELDEPESSPMIAPSQGIHIVLDRAFLPGNAALLVPRTRDGRVMFAIPWLGVTLVGTTDTAVDRADLEPKPLPEEVDFLLETTAQYLTKAPTRADIRSLFAGIRPLVRGNAVKTAKLARDHVIRRSPSGLLTIAGGKWTTYRHMAEQCVDQAAAQADLPRRPCITRRVKLQGWRDDRGTQPSEAHLDAYGTDGDSVRALIQTDPAFAERIHPALPYRVGEVHWAARQEMARTVDDILARRTRSLIINAPAALEAAPRVAEILAKQLGYDSAWQTEQVATFREIAQGYIP